MFRPNYDTRSRELKVLSIVHPSCSEISLKMAQKLNRNMYLELKSNIILQKHKFVYDCIIYILCNILAYIQHFGHVSLDQKNGIFGFGKSNILFSLSAIPRVKKCTAALHYLDIQCAEFYGRLKSSFTYGIHTCKVLTSGSSIHLDY